MFDIATETKLFNDYIIPTVPKLFAAKSKMWDRIKKSDKLQLGGKAAKQKIVISHSQASGASSTAAYPTAQETTPEETLVYLKRAQMFQIKYDGFALETAMKGGTPIDPETFEKDGVLVTAIDDLSRQIMLDGTGHLCQANGAGNNSTALIVDSPFYADATKFLKVGRVIDSYVDSSATTGITAASISAVPTTLTATLSAGETWIDDEYIFNYNTHATSEAAATGEMMGLMGIISASDPPYPNASAGLQGITVAAHPEWAAISKGNSGVDRALTEDLIASAIDSIERGTITVMLYTMKLRRVWASLLRDYKITDSKTMWGGWSGLPYYYDGKEIPMVVDRFVPDGHILGLDESKLTLFVADKRGEVVWEQGRDGTYLQKVAGQNQYVSEGHVFANLGVSDRGCFFKLYDLSEPTT